MTPGAILFGIALLILVVLYIAQPLFLNTGAPQPRRRMLPDKRQELLVHKEALLEQIRTLDFDYDTGKIPAETHAAQRAALVAEASETLKQLDALPKETAPVAVTTLAEIEAAIAQRRARGGAPAQPANGEAEAAAAPAVAASAGKFCSQCGQPVKPTDKFCAACGYALVTAVTS
jgi:NADH pyrophosphatase NudC (nudix superfamily)